MIQSYVPKEDIKETFDIQVRRLDEYLQKQKLSYLSLIKIDTEGFELPVLLGASRFFDECKGNFPPVIAEITPRAFKLMGRDVCELDEFMSSYRYKSYSICGRHRINIRKIINQTNVLFKT